MSPKSVTGSYRFNIMPSDEHYYSTHYHAQVQYTDVVFLGAKQNLQKFQNIKHLANSMHALLA